jgi:arylsulfatase A-like enzyme
MRILYVDVDTLRADHLGCYGYPRRTSPSIDALAAGGLRFERCYASDVPCLPSRTALSTGRFGIHNGVASHGGVAADPRPDGARRGFWSSLGTRSFATQLARRGFHTATISSFAERHSAYHWYAGFREVRDPGKFGLETADEVAALALDWLARNARREAWFLHVHFWDPHTPYRTPDAYGNPFEGDPVPGWLDEDVRAAHWQRPGPHSAQEMLGFTPAGMWRGAHRRQPERASDLREVRRMFDGYDAGVRYADDHVGRLLDALARAGVFDDTAVMVSADHGETLGELGIYCDHHTADECVARVPLVLRWPGLAPRALRGLRYQIDVAATLLELAGAAVPRGWDGESFAEDLRAGRDEGRPFLVLTQGAWTAQRGIRFDDWLCLRTYHDGYHDFPETLLFDLAADPHEQRDLAEKRPDVVARAHALLDAWHGEAMRTSSDGVDPLQTVLREGGPWHVRGQLPAYLKRLTETGRAAHAARLAARWPDAAAGR